jgi:serine/threonine protein kinase
MALTPGTRLGPYEIVAPLGSGGMGDVYKARDTRLDRDVSRIFVSWNQLDGWLRQLDGLRAESLAGTIEYRRWMSLQVRRPHLRKRHVSAAPDSILGRRSRRI